jgi:hypothetical protein
VELSKDEKLDFIKSQGLQYFESETVSLDELWHYAMIKEMVVQHDVKCFGYYDDQSEICKLCYLHKQNTCNKLQNYLQLNTTRKYADQMIKVVIRKDYKEEGVKMESLDVILSKLQLKPTCKVYKIAELILKSDNRPYSDILNEILKMYDNKISVRYATIRFSQVKHLIQTKTNLRIETIIQKYVHITERI